MSDATVAQTLITSRHTMIRVLLLATLLGAPV
jgi:hypothetical protein